MRSSSTCSSTTRATWRSTRAVLRTNRPPLLAVWGRNDRISDGAEAFKRDIPGADVRFVDTGHFALQTHVEEIATAIGEFLTRSPSPQHAGQAASEKG